MTNDNRMDLLRDAVYRRLWTSILISSFGAQVTMLAIPLTAAVLLRVADVYDREVRSAVKRMLSLLEPVLILGLGLVIGAIIMSILVAILSVNDLAM